MPTIEACVRVFEQAGNRDNKLRARIKWLVDRLGFDELQRRILASRRFLVASSSWPGGIPAQVVATGDAPGTGSAPTAVGQGTPVFLTGNRAAAMGPGQRGARCRQAPCRPWRGHGSATSPPPSSAASPPSPARSTPRSASPTARTSCCEGCRGPAPGPARPLVALGMAKPGAELARDVVACPGADTCNLAVTQSRGLADAIGEALEAAGLAEVGGVRTNISGCTNSCGQHHTADIGLLRRRTAAHGSSAPGCQRCCSAATSVTARQDSARRRCACPPGPPGGGAHRRPLLRGAPGGRDVRSWLGRSAAPAIAAELKGPRRVPDAGGEPRLLRRLRRDRPVPRRSSASRVRPDGDHHPRQQRVERSGPAPDRSSPRSPTPSSPSSPPDSSQPRRRRSSVGRRQLRAAPGVGRVDDRRRADRPGGQRSPGDRGRLHRHRPTSRDARDRREGPATTG